MLPVFVLAATLATGAGVSAAASLAGQWRLDADRSEDARVRLREGSRVRPRGGFGGPMSGGPAGGRPVGGTPMGGFPRDRSGSSDEAAGPLRTFLEPPHTLVIKQEGGEIAIDDGAVVLRVHPGGRPTKTDNGGGEVRAHWRDDELVLETRLRDGGRIVSAYRAAADGRELNVTSTYEAQFGEPVTVRRVYEVAGEGSAPSPHP